MQSDGINLMNFLSNENHNLSWDAVSKSQRILNWISNDLNTSLVKISWLD